MTAEELRTRKRELLDRRREEIALQNRGEGDNLALFLVEEELLDVNAQLRLLAPGRRVGARQVGEHGADRRQFAEWRDRENSLDDEIAQGRDALLRGAVQSLDVLTERQREVWTLWTRGLSTRDIGRRLGVHHATAARTLSRARRALAEETERFAAAQRSPETVLDMGDPSTAKLVLSAVTARQAAYLYLYYAEWLSLREVGVLTGTHHSAVLRTIRRGLRNIGGVLGYREAELVHMEKLDELVYEVYRQVEDLDSLVPPERRPSSRKRKKEEDWRRRVPALPPMEISTDAGRWTPALWSRRTTGPRRRGKLLTALLRRARAEGKVGRGLCGWLVGLFQKLAGGMVRSAGRWRKRHILERTETEC